MEGTITMQDHREGISRVRIKHGFYLLVEKFMHWLINPYLRAFVLRLLGAKIGKNVRIYEVKFMNLMDGFINLYVEDDAHIGTDVLIDLQGKVIIKKGATISPRCSMLTHSNPGEYQSSPICQIFPAEVGDVVIGRYSWIGACTTIFLGVEIGDLAVVGANSLVNQDIPARTLSYGVPARVVRQLRL